MTNEDDYDDSYSVAMVMIIPPITKLPGFPGLWFTHALGPLISDLFCSCCPWCSWTPLVGLAVLGASVCLFLPSPHAARVGLLLPRVSSPSFFSSIPRYCAACSVALLLLFDPRVCSLLFSSGVSLCSSSYRSFLSFLLQLPTTVPSIWCSSADWICAGGGRFGARVGGLQVDSLSPSCSLCLRLGCAGDGRFAVSFLS